MCGHLAKLSHAHSPYYLVQNVYEEFLNIFFTLLINTYCTIVLSKHEALIFNEHVVFAVVY